jgi:CRP/FNR family transcriptional regulator, cyclic AMP receptor protein
MRSPYGLEITESCQTCKLRNENSFCKLPPTALRDFEAIRFTTSYPENAILFVEGQMPRGVFIVCQGRVKLSTSSSEGKTLILRIARPGEVLGLSAAIAGTPFEVTAETLHPCQVNFVGRDDFLRFIRDHGEAGVRAAQSLSSSYNSACDQLRTLGLAASAPEKLARLLLDWSTQGENSPQGTRVKLGLTHEEISQLIGTSRETVTRILGDFRARHLAALRGSTLVIQDKAGLQSYVSS